MGWVWWLARWCCTLYLFLYIFNVFNVRPPDDIRERTVHMFHRACFLIIRLKPFSPRLAQKYVKGCITGWTCSVHSDISPNTLLNFSGSQRVRNFCSIFDTSRLWRAVVLKRSNIIGNLKHSPRARQWLILFLTPTFRTPVPWFYKGSKTRNFA